MKGLILLNQACFTDLFSASWSKSSPDNDTYSPVLRGLATPLEEATGALTESFNIEEAY